MASLDESEREELNRLRQEVATLTQSNDSLVASIHTLSGELLKRRHQPLLSSSSLVPIPAKRVKPLDTSSVCRPQKGALHHVKKETTDKDDLPNEIMLHLFKYLERSTLDQCRLVCSRWKNLIEKHQTSLARRRIRLFKIIETGPNVIMFSAATSTNNIKVHFNIDADNQNQELIDRVAKMLTYSRVRRLVLCGFHLCEVLLHDLTTIFKKADVLFHRLEIIGVSLRNLSADTFQKFIGEQINADQYFLDGVKDADTDHFGSKLFERTAIKKAEDLTIYDISSVTNEDLPLEIADETLLDYIFGKYTDALDRATLYLDSPSISSAFVYNALVRFVQEPDLKHAIPHSELAHCRPQVVHNSRTTRFEYDVQVQAEYSAYNPKTKSILEAKISRSADDDDDFVHVTLTIIT